MLQISQITATDIADIFRITRMDGLVTAPVFLLQSITYWRLHSNTVSRGLCEQREHNKSRKDESVFMDSVDAGFVGGNAMWLGSGKGQTLCRLWDS